MQLNFGLPLAVRRMPPLNMVAIMRMDKPEQQVRMSSLIHDICQLIRNAAERELIVSVIEKLRRVMQREDEREN